ncbi:MAG: sulfatase-like hydrolase/transferase [Planctomycetaceae bacterium]
MDTGVDTGVDTADWLLFSNPDSTRGRHHITIKASPDRGLTWPKQHRLLLDEGISAGYSCMSMIDPQTVGILYEGSQAQMTFQRIPLNDVVGRTMKADNSPVRPHKKASQRKLKMPLVFNSHMVLQADATIPIWGRGRPGSKVAVAFGDEIQTTTTSDNGQWQVRLQPRAATQTPSVMLIESAGERIRFGDILIGEVWVCAGQSNMEWSLAESVDGDKELSNAAHPTLRLLRLSAGARGSSGPYTSAHLARLQADTFCHGTWTSASAATAREFSAVGWYFGRHLQRVLHVPIGLICPAVGGTPTEAWIPHNALESDPDLGELVVGNWLDNERLGEFCRVRGLQNLLPSIQAGEAIPGDSLGPNHSFKPGFMWSAGIQPLIPYAIRGVIWYQGESNAETARRVREHSRLFPLLINQWRHHWGQGAFPFLYVQLPAMNRSEWPGFREGQRRALGQLKNVGMAVTIDTGHPTNVHPTLKRPVGERLAMWALGTTYGVPLHRNYSGPLFETAKRQPNSIIVTFSHVAGGLESADGKPLRHFEVCGQGGVFHTASARISGRDTVEVQSHLVPHPQDVRYAWLPYPTPAVNLSNMTGLPASPFTTETEENPISRSKTSKPRRSKSRSRPNILLIVGEDHGCELSCYGDPVITTPNIDGLASQGVLFENGYVTQSVCSPSRSTIFTGLYPHQNGQLGLATHQYAWFRKWPTTYSLLKQAGYRTGLIGKTHVVPAEAVESFVDYRFQKSANFAKRNVSDYAVKAGAFFKAGEAPFFMTVNYPDAHWPLQDRVDGLPTIQLDRGQIEVMPYIGGDTPRMRDVVRNYYHCMLRLDTCVGQLLKQLDASGKADNTLVVFVGDHGAQMARGKVTVYEGGVRVPYIVRWPGVAKPQHRSQALVSTIDLLPTFMDAAATPPPSGLPGRSLRPVLLGGDVNTFRKYLVCERNCDAARHTFPQRTIRDARYKLIHSLVRDREDPAARYYRSHGASHWAGSLTDAELAKASRQTQSGYARWLNPPEFQLYDLEADPHEWSDLGDDPNHAVIRERLADALTQWQQETHDPLAAPEKLRMLMDENDAVFKSGLRSPKTGWRYLQYLAPD